MKSYDQLREEGWEANNEMVMESVQKYLEEKLLIVGKGKKHGQAVILAGGAGSGKSFAVNNMMQGDLFKVINPDDIKDLLLKMREKNKKGLFTGSETTASILKRVATLDLLNPEDAAKLHQMVKDLDIDDKREMLMFAGKRQSGLLPNVMFDATLKSPSHLYGDAKGEGGYLAMLAAAGYKPENIHIVWVLTNYNVAIQGNLTRNRVVRTDILLGTHTGAATTMVDHVFKNYKSLGINGDVVVILGGPKNTVLYKEGDKVKGPDGKIYTLSKDTAQPVIKDFTYFVVKRAGQSEMDSAALSNIYKWIRRNAPPPNIDAKAAQDAVVGKMKAQGKELNPKIAKYLGYTT
jgi:hypothetical protein